MPNIITNFEPAEVLKFIADKQQSPATACAYLGTDAADIAGDLGELDQPWESTTKVVLDDNRNITGVILAEWDLDLNRAEIYGPWTDSIPIAVELLADTLADSPVQNNYLYAPVGNELITAATQRLGFLPGDLTFEMEHARDIGLGGEIPTLSIIRNATLADTAAIETIHDAEFPDTYATAADLLDPDGRYHTVVYEKAGQVVGYLAYQLGTTSYLDFIAVSPEHRGQGIGRALITALIDIVKSSPKATNLTLTADSADVVKFYESLGFQVISTNRSYLLQSGS